MIGHFLCVRRIKSIKLSDTLATLVARNLCVRYFVCCIVHFSILLAVVAVVAGRRGMRACVHILFFNLRPLISFDSWVELLETNHCFLLRHL